MGSRGNEQSAEETLNGWGAYTIEKRPCWGFLNGEQVETGDYMLVRSPVPDDNREVNLGYVSKHYNVFQPIEVAQEFDKSVGQPCETIGNLNRGEKLFITWKLDPIIVDALGGDPVDTFGLVVAGFDGVVGNSLYLTVVRVVCQNTLNLAINRSERENSRTNSRLFLAKHNSKNMKRDLSLWMSHVQNSANDKLSDVASIFNNMAKVQLNEKEEVYNLLFQIYPNPEKPADWQPEKLKEEAWVKYDEKVAESEKDRDLVFQLFNGSGTKITPDTWGLLNSVTEYENHAGMIKKPINNSILFGNRANRMEHAFAVLTDYTESRLSL